MAKSFEVDVTPELSGERLDKAIAALCEGVSRTLARKVLSVGGVRIDGRRVRAASRPVQPGQTLSITVSERLLAPVEERPLQIIHEGAGFVVLHKPAGQHVQATAEGDKGTVERSVARWLRGKDAAPRRSATPVHIVHRLDAEASGLLIVATDRAAAAHFSAQLRDHSIERRYLALVEGVAPAMSGSIDLPLAGVREGRVEVDPVGGREARTHYQVRAVYGPSRFSLLELQLETGRTHQIRVHLAEAIGPIVGDSRYGSRWPKQRLRLHAHRLCTTAPDGATPLVFSHEPNERFFALPE